VLNLLKDNGMVEFSLEQLNRYMLNMGDPQFDYETLKVAYDSDPRISDIIKDFTQDTIELKTSEVDDLNPKSSTARTTVKQMAKKATNLGKKL